MMDLTMNFNVGYEATAPLHITQDTEVFLWANCSSDYVGFVNSVKNALSSRLSLVSYCDLSLQEECNNGDVWDQSSILYDFFHRVPLLRVLKVKIAYFNFSAVTMHSEISAYPSFPNILAAPDEVEDNFLLPNLRELYVNLEDKSHGEDELYCAHRWKTLCNLFTDLTTTLGSRKERGLRLSILTIHASRFLLDTGNCPDNTLERFVTQLQDVVSKVVVVRPREIAGWRKVGHLAMTEVSPRHTILEVSKDTPNSLIYLLVRPELTFRL